MYKVVPVPGGWRVIWEEAGRDPIFVDGRIKPYPHRTHAYRKARALAKRDTPVNAMITETGAIII